MIKTITVKLREKDHFKFKNKVKYYDLNIKDVLAIFIDNFSNTDKFDDLFNIPKD